MSSWKNRREVSPGFLGGYGLDKDMGMSPSSLVVGLQCAYPFLLICELEFVDVTSGWTTVYGLGGT